MSQSKVSGPVLELLKVFKSKDFANAEEPVNKFLAHIDSYVHTENQETGSEWHQPLLFSDELPSNKEGILIDKLLLVISKCMTRAKKMRNGREIKARNSVFGALRLNIELANGTRLMTVSESKGTFSFVPVADDSISEVTDILSDFDEIDSDDDLEIL